MRKKKKGPQSPDSQNHPPIRLALQQGDTSNAVLSARTLPLALVARDARGKAAPAHHKQRGAPTRLALQQRETSNAALSARTLPPALVARDARGKAAPAHRKRRGARQAKSSEFTTCAGTYCARCTSSEDGPQRGARRGTRRSEMQARGSHPPLAVVWPPRQPEYAYHEEDDEDKAAIEWIKLLKVGKEGARPQQPGMSAGCAGTRRKNERGEMVTQSGRVERARIPRRRKGTGSKMQSSIRGCGKPPVKATDRSRARPTPNENPNPKTKKKRLTKRDTYVLHTAPARLALPDAQPARRPPREISRHRRRRGALGHSREHLRVVLDPPAHRVHWSRSCRRPVPDPRLRTASASMSRRMEIAATGRTARAAAVRLCGGCARAGG
ncbi:hypothetical protein C8J57DRAFT_1468434 [Mycena rebaudengoi]|nr:hypothetical protein C8J57DRAFT_1468434 [Mycena rebaudengoi]